MLLLHAAAVRAFPGGIDFALSLDDIRHPAFVAERVVMRPQGSGATLVIGRLRVAEREFRDIQLMCRQFDWRGGELRCRGGSAKAGAGGTTTVKFPQVEFHYVAARKSLDLTLRDAPVASLAVAVPALAAWQVKGQIDAVLHLVGTRAEFSLTTRALAFGNAAGTEAGEGIGLALAGTARQVAGAWNGQFEATWQAGEVFVAPWYVKAGGQRLTLAASLDHDEIRVPAARLDLPGVGALDAGLRWHRGNGQLAALEVASDTWDASAVVGQWVQPMLGETPRVRASGALRFALALDATGPSRIDLDLDLPALDVGEGRLALAGLRAKVPWRRDGGSQASISVAGGQVGAIPLGGFVVPLTMTGWRFGFDRVKVPLLDGAALFEKLDVQRANDGWQWQLAASLEPMSMPLLSEKLGLPRMTGVLSATIPRIAYVDRVLQLDGALAVSVFDGYLSASGLRVIDPFGRSPQLVADIAARHLDLAMLTDTFSFGSITGHIDADVKGLELLGWQPQGFFARVETSPGDFDKRISQRAVQNISSLGGAGAGAAIQRSFLRFFETFGYEKIALSCHLVGGVCAMGGIEDAAGDGAYLMVKGGGLPSLNVMGYNRRVGWDELVSRLRAIAAGNSRPVIE